MERTWAEIDVDALKSNIKNIKKLVGDKKVMAVVKADAYGHGYKECSRILLENGADSLGVATVSEAKQLRHEGFNVPILILGATFPEEAEDIINFDIIPTVFDFDYAKHLSNVAESIGKNVKIHIKIDTGMTRIGLNAETEAVEEIIKISKLPYVEIDGIFSHFACADEENPEYTRLQLERFNKVLNELKNHGIEIPCVHISNSAGIMMYPEARFDMVRAGIVLYGYHPSDEVDKEKLSIKPVMTFKTRITQIKEVESGVGVSYGKTYITDKRTKIATIPVGYADGYSRGLSQKAKVEIGGELFDVIGRICMDQCMIDVTNANNINVGDEVILFGGGKMTAEDIAKGLNTISYEVLCQVSKRIPRIYKEKGREIAALNYLDKI